MPATRPGKQQISDVILSVRFTPEEDEVIRTLAKYHRLTVSELIRRAVLEHHALEERMTPLRSLTRDPT